MRSTLKKLTYALALGTLIAGPAFAQDVAPAHTETVKRIMDSQPTRAQSMRLRRITIAGSRK